MPNSPNRVALDRVDWSAVVPIVRLAGSFRQALQPGKLIVALLAVVLLHGCGLFWDVVWGMPVDGVGDAEYGVYEAIVLQEQSAFARLVDSALSLHVGLGPTEPGVLDALHAMFIETPAWAFDQHPWFTLAFGIDALVLIALAGGVICRMAATQACLGQTVSVLRAGRFVAGRWLWYVLTPLMPTLLILVLGGVLMLTGLVFFNLPVLDVVGSLAYGPMLAIGFVIALVTVLLVFALVLMAPALSVEGTDGFDAISRSFNYVLFRPWQFGAYLFAAAAYTAVVYVLVAALAGLTVQATHAFVEAGAFAEVETEDAGEMTRHEIITTESARATSNAEIGLAEPSATLGPSAWITRRWFDLLAGVVATVLFSTICCLQTQVYLLMRRSADGTPLDDCAADEHTDPWSNPVDMVDPQAQAIASAGPSAQSAPPTPDDQAPEG